jgi:hypothetical protein
VSKPDTERKDRNWYQNWHYLISNREVTINSNYAILEKISPSILKLSQEKVIELPDKGKKEDRTNTE